MSHYEEVKLADMKYDPEEMMYFYLCPCGDEFEISLEELWDGEDVAPCPSCSLKIRVLFEESDLPPLPDDDGAAPGGAEAGGAEGGEAEAEGVPAITQGLRGVDLANVSSSTTATAAAKGVLEDEEGEGVENGEVEEVA